MCQFGSMQCSGSKPSSTRTPRLVKVLLFFLSRDSESGYYRVLSHYYAEDSEKLSVKASSLVFVLARGVDGWATVIHDGQVRKTGGLSSPSPPAETTALPVKRSCCNPLSTFLGDPLLALQSRGWVQELIPTDQLLTMDFSDTWLPLASVIHLCSSTRASFWALVLSTTQVPVVELCRISELTKDHHLEQYLSPESSNRAEETGWSLPGVDCLC